MRQRAEHQCGVRERRVLGRDEGHAPAANAHCRAALIVRRSECQRERGMGEDKRTELAADVATRPEHSNGNSIHQECIIMRRTVVNAIRQIDAVE